MPRLSKQPDEESFSFRVDRQLRAAFEAEAEREDRPAAQLLREFMRTYVERRRERAHAVEARRQSAVIATRAADPGSDEAAVMGWMQEVADRDGWVA